MTKDPYSYELSSDFEDDDWYDYQDYDYDRFDEEMY
jgi:hypothetical protein